MKKKISFLISLLLLPLSACGTEKEKNIISTTFAPIYDFTKRIVGDKSEVICLVGNNELHDFSLNKPQDVAKVKDSKLVVSLGLGVDTFIEGVNDEKLFTCTDKIELRKVGNNFDPHVWLSINNAIKMMENIAEKIIEIDSENKEYYAANLNTAKSEFTTLYEEFVKGTSYLNGSSIVTSHEAFYYLGQELGFSQYGIADIANNEITSQRIIEVKNYIVENNIHTIYLESLTSSKNIDTIINEVQKDDANYSIDKKELSAFEGVDVSKWDQDNYLTVMKNNLEALKE